MPDEIVETPEVDGATTTEKTTSTEQETSTKAESIIDESKETETAPGAWPESWREDYAGDDQKKLNQLTRYASPKAALDALFSAQKRISQGELGPKKPGENATDEEKAAYREALGVPEKADDYYAELPNGLVIGEADKDLFDSFGELMHGLNAPKEIVQSVADWYYKEVVDKAEQAAYDMARQAEDSFQETLREEYGSAFKSNINGVEAMLDMAPDGVKENFLNAIDPNGGNLRHNVDVIRWLVDINNQLNPVASAVPGITNIQGLTERKAELKSIMTNDRERWFKETELQEEYQKLLKAEEKMAARQA